LSKDTIPSISFYDQDFVDLYDRTWIRIEEYWKQKPDDGFSGPEGCLLLSGQETYSLFDACLSSLFLCYSNQIYSPFPMLDYFYHLQEEDGAIRNLYSTKDGSFVPQPDNPDGLCIPLLAYIEFNFYHKIGNKKRLKDSIPYLQKYFAWIAKLCKQENGLYAPPLAACQLGDIPRKNVIYPIDFNAQMALNALYMSYIGDILNDKELSFTYKQMFFALKTRINNLMWDPIDNFYYDLDKNEKPVKDKHIGAFWTLLAEIPNGEKAAYLVESLKDPEVFGTDNPFPCVPVSSPAFNERGEGYCGSVLPFFTFMVCKGLEKYGEFIFARDCAIRHLYFILDTLHPEEDKVGDLWEAYLPTKEGAPRLDEATGFPRKRFLPQIGLITITLMIEDIIGLDISLPRKTVDWTMPTLESMGVDNLSLKRNFVSIFCNKNDRGWEARLESEKLYYFTIIVLDQHKKKTLPIPSGKCSILIDKL
jgi:neutral trehalase